MDGECYMNNEKNKKSNKRNKFNFVSMDELGKVSIDLGRNNDVSFSNDAVKDISFESDKKQVVCSDDAFVDLKVSSHDVQSRSLYDTMAIEDIVSFASNESFSNVSLDHDDIESANDDDNPAVSSSVDNDFNHFHYGDLEEDNFFQKEDIKEDKNRIHGEFNQDEDRIEDKDSEEKLIEDIEKYYPDYSEIKNQEEKKKKKKKKLFLIPIIILILVQKNSIAMRKFLLNLKRRLLVMVILKRVIIKMIMSLILIFG